MLGNHADAFFTTPMPTRVTSGNSQMVANGGMPAPRELNVGATQVPFFGADPAPAPAPASGGLIETLKEHKLLVLGGLAAAFLFLTPAGKRIRAKVGLA